MFEWLRQRKTKEKDQPKAEQVMAEVIDPVEPDSSSSQVPSDSLRALLRTAITDAEKIAASIKAGAEKEAGAETRRIIAQTELEAQKIKGEAEISARQQADGIISEAKKQAEVTLVELKHQTLQFLISTSEEVREEISKDYKKAYSLLSSSLQDIMTEAENFDRPLKDKVTDLWESKSLGLKEFETTLLGTAEATTVETIAELVKPVEETVVETIAEPVEPEEEPIVVTIAEPVKPEEEPVVVTIAEPVEPEEEPIVATIAEPVKSKGRKRRSTVKVDQDNSSAIISDEALYTGTIELNIASPTELNLISKLYNFLQTVPELRILYTRGSWDSGTKITVVLEKAMPLIGILSNSPEFKVTAMMLEEDSKTVEKSNALLRGEERAVQRMELALEEK